MEREIAYFIYKYCNNHLPATFEGIVNKNTLRLSSKESQQTRRKSNLLPYFVEYGRLNKTIFKL